MNREMKRHDRQVFDKKEIDAIITQCRVCRLGMFDGKEPYLVPMSFGYKDQTVYLHGARVGRKMDIISANPLVCVEFDRALEMVTDEDTACKWSQKFESVIAWGKAEILIQHDEKIKAFNIIMSQYSERQEWSYEDALIERTGIIKIPIDRLTAKRFQ